jgi:hypothetical protein
VSQNRDSAAGVAPAVITRWTLSLRVWGTLGEWCAVSGAEVRRDVNKAEHQGMRPTGVDPATFGLKGRMTLA